MAQANAFGVSTNTGQQRARQTTPCGTVIRNNMANMANTVRDAALAWRRDSPTARPKQDALLLHHIVGPTGHQRVLCATDQRQLPHKGRWWVAPPFSRRG
jgi:hypothetical protein